METAVEGRQWTLEEEETGADDKGQTWEEVPKWLQPKPPKDMLQALRDAIAK